MEGDAAETPSADDAAKRRAAGLVGELLGGRYRVEFILAFGGMGAVLLAMHVHMRRRVALKLLHPTTANLPELVARFERESVVNAHLAHPNVCAAMDFGQFADGSHYLVLEYVDGRSLRDVLREGPMAPRRAAGIARQLADALGAAHTLGIVHRDVKPGNVMVQASEADAPADAVPHVKIVDFGLAGIPSALFRPDDDLAVTRAGTVFGTVAYMAPELAGGMHFVDNRSDLYALGIVLYEMLTGRHPFDSKEPAALFREHRSSPVPEMSDRAPGIDVPRALEEITRRLLEKQPSARFQTADELLDALDAVYPPPQAASASLRRSRMPPPPASTPRSVATEAHVTSGDVADDSSHTGPRPTRRARIARARAAKKHAQEAAAEAPPPAPDAAVEAPPPAPVARRPAGRGLVWLSLAAVGAVAIVAAGARVPAVRAALGIDQGSAAAAPSETAMPEARARQSASATRSAPSARAHTSASAPASGASASAAAAAGSASPSASASAPAGAPTVAAADDPALRTADVMRLRGVLREASEVQDVKRGARALLDLAKAAPAAFGLPDVILNAAAIAVLVETGDRSMADEVFDALSGPSVGVGGADVLFHVVCFSGGSRGATRAQALLAKPEVIARASPSMRIARELRAAPCAARPALYDRAAAEGDERALTVLAAMRADACEDNPGACCAISDKHLAETVTALRKRLRK